MEVNKPKDFQQFPEPQRELAPLRSEINHLRLELQSLAREVDDASQVKGLLKKNARELWRRLRATPSKLLRKRSRSAGPAPTPYRVRQPNRIPPGSPKVLHVVANFYTGGSSRLVVDLLEGLEGYEQRVVTRDLPPHPAYTGLSLEQVKETHSAGPALKTLRAFRPDLVHIHYLGHRRNAYSLQDWRWYRQFFDALEHYQCPVIQNVNIPVQPYFSRRVGYYVFVSDYVRNHFGFSDCANLTIYPGSDLSLFSRRPGTAFPDDCIGMVYRLEGDKLDERSIDVFINVVKKRPATKAIIVGGGTFLQPYQEAVRRAGLEKNFSFPGYDSYESLPGWLEKLSIFVAPVHRESFGQVTPFAMGMCLPVAGYQVGALHEILGTPGLLAAPGDAVQLAEIVIRLLEAREERLLLGTKNRRRAEARFSVEAMVEAYRGLYAQALK